MFKRLSIFCLGLLIVSTGARADSLRDFQRALTTGAHRSLSGQFVVHDLPPENFFSPRRSQLTDSNAIELDSTLLAVSCERIKKNLISQIGVRDHWQGKIFVVLRRRAQGGDESISVAPARFGHDWAYQLEMPDRVERSQLVSAVVEVLLLEMAGRNSDRSTEIPAWLSQGMSREVIFASEDELILDRPNAVENHINLNRLTRTNLLNNPLVQAHEELQTVAPLTLEELSWPKPDQFEGSSGEAYRSSAQLFVHELLQLPGGHECFQAFLSELPQHLNWQIAFLNAFHSHFGSQLDMEKWWALRLEQFTGRDLAQMWRAEESWRKLDEIVRPAVEVRTDTDELPLHTQITLQSVIQEWDIPRQSRLLQEKSQQLSLLRLRVSQDLIYLVDDYRRALDEYVKKRGKSINAMGRNGSLDDLARNALATLDALEMRRQQLRPNPQIAPAITADSSLNN